MRCGVDVDVQRFMIDVDALGRRHATCALTRVDEEALSDGNAAQRARRHFVHADGAILVPARCGKMSIRVLSVRDLVPFIGGSGAHYGFRCPLWVQAPVMEVQVSIIGGT